MTQKAHNLLMYWEGLDVTEYVADLIVFLCDFFKNSTLTE